MKPKLIIIPGWSGNELLWQHQTQHLRDIVDPEVITLTDLDDVEKMADAILERAPEKFILAGHSLGGWAAQWAAIKAPERVSQLILIATWNGASRSSMVQLFNKMLQTLETKDVDVDAFLDEVMPVVLHPDRRKTILPFLRKAQAKFPKQGLINQTKAEINSKPTTTLLNKIQCPTLVVCGRQDEIFSLEEQQAVAEKIADAKLTIVEDCGHMISIEQPQALTALMRLWVSYLK